MSYVRRRGLAAAALAVAASLSLSACGTSFGAQTNKVYQPGIGANHRGDVDVLNTLLVANQDGSATVSAAVVNRIDAEQEISSVTATTLDDDPLEVRSLKTSLPLPSEVLVPIGDSSDAGGYRVVEGAEAGAYVKVTFTFSDSGAVTIQAPVVARSEIYDDVAGDDGLAPTEVDEPAATASPEAESQ